MRDKLEMGGWRNQITPARKKRRWEGGRGEIKVEQDTEASSMPDRPSKRDERCRTEGEGDEEKGGKVKRQGGGGTSRLSER